jgi:hypothetical protein
MTTHAGLVESDLGRFYALFPQPELARDLFNIVEGHRVDARLRQAYPGIRRDMLAIAAATLERRGGFEPTMSDAQAVVEGLLAHTLGAQIDVSPLPVAVADMVTEAIAVMATVAATDASVATSAAVAARLYELIDDGPRAARRRDMSDVFPQDSRDEGAAEPGQDDPEGGPPPAGPSGGGADDYSAMDLPPFMTPVLEELVKQRAKEQAEAGETPPSDSPDEVDGAMQSQQAQPGGERAGDEAAQRGERSPEQVPVAPGDSPEGIVDDQEGGGSDMDLAPGAEIPLVASDEDDSEEDLGEQTFYYDEWDHKIEDYRPAWCTLRESRATRVHEGFVAATFHEHGGVVSQIRRNFQLMRPERLRKMRYQPDGDDLDIEGIVEYVVDRRTRISPTDRVYIKRDKKDRDVATVFLVDMSSSTDRKIDGRKRIIDVEKESLLLMCEALEAIRDEYAIYGFSGSGREDCQFYTVKEIGERYDDRVKSRIGGIYGRQKTRMGPALRHATKRLMAVDAHVKLLILLTDGKPYDSDTYQDNTYAQEDTKMALREARREKIHLFCVTVDQEAADYLPHMYSDANFVIIDDVTTLPHKLPQLYRRLTS